MRSFAIVAFCLLAAQVNAWTVSEGVKCVSEKFGQAVNASFKDMIDRVEKINDHKNDIAEKLEKELADIRDEFSRELKQEMDNQRNSPDNCDEGNFAQRIACQVKRRFGMATAGARVAGKALSRAVSTLRDHAKDFGGSRLTGLGQIISAVRENLPGLLQSARECFSDQE